MKKRLFAWTLAIALVLSLTACGGSSYQSSGADRGMAKNSYAAEAGAVADEDAYYYDEPAEAEEYKADNGSGDSGGQNSAYQNAKVKLIRRASVRLETKEFDAAVRGLEKLVDELGGYVEESSVNQGGYGSTYRSASYTVRVPAGKYSDFLTRVSEEEHCHLASKDESTEDVGQQYFDTETRLKTLRTKLERLQDLLAQAKHMDDIITLEQAITDTEYEIERYSSTLNRYDSLIGYATFQVSIEQVVSISDTDTLTFGERLGNAFLGGLESFVEGVQEFLVWLVGHIFVLALLVVIVLLLRFFLRRRRIRREEKLRAMGIDPKAKKTGWSPRKNKVPPTPFAPPAGRQAGDSAPNVEPEKAPESVESAPDSTADGDNSEE